MKTKTNSYIVVVHLSINLAQIAWLEGWATQAQMVFENKELVKSKWQLLLHLFNLE